MRLTHRKIKSKEMRKKTNIQTTDIRYTCLSTQVDLIGNQDKKDM